MNWDNLKNGGCPKCNNKLQCRVAGNKFKIKARHKINSSKDDLWYFCSKCDGFQISGKRFAALTLKTSIGIEEIPKQDVKLFSSGLLRL